MGRFSHEQEAFAADGSWYLTDDRGNSEADMIARVGPPTAANSFSKAEGIVPASTGDAVVFSESGAGSDPGRVWKLTSLAQDVVRGHVLVEGDFGRLSRPDNLRFTDAGDLFVMEDHSSSDFAANPSTGGANDVWVLPRGGDGAADLVLFATLPNRFEPTGPWFGPGNDLLYLSVQADPPFASRVIAIRREGGNFNQPF